jgi:enamine deaminase RidA (YjgF/YER057c/UK114 family)
LGGFKLGATEKLKELGIRLPEPFAAMGSYVPSVLAGDLLFVAGHPPVENGKIRYKGKVGKDLTLEEGRHAAELCIINCLAAAQAALGDLDRVKRVVKVTGYVNCLSDFEKQPDVINGASDLLQKIWGEAGRHARAAVGAVSLPANIAVEVEVVFEVKA